MQAYFETEAIVSANHRVSIDLPISIPAGRVKIAVIYQPEQFPSESCLEAAQSGNLDLFLSNIPLNEHGRSRDSILNQVREERESWGD